MKRKQRVLVYGNTVALAGIEASISLDPACEIIGHAWPVDHRELGKLHPDVVVFMLDATWPELALTLSTELPGLLLIGIDPETNRAVVWSGKQAEGWSSQELVQAIRNHGAITAATKMKGGEHVRKA